MDAWILRAVSGAFDRSFRGGILGVLRPDIGGRLRLPVEMERGTRDIWIDLKPGDPWIASALRRTSGEPPARDLGDLPTRLAGRRIAAVEHPSLDRWVRLRMECGGSLIVELLPTRPRLLWLDADGSIVDGRPLKRISPGIDWKAPLLPVSKIVVVPFTARAVRQALELPTVVKIPLWDRLTQLFGVSPLVRDQLKAEIAGAGLSQVAEELVGRLEDLSRGFRVPHCEGVEDERSLEKASGSIPNAIRVFPWGERSMEQPWSRDACRVIGRFHGWQDRLRTVHTRVRALTQAIDREDRRTTEALVRVSDEQARFVGEGEKARRMGEALLAGLLIAKRRTGVIEVPDPWREENLLCFPDEPGRSLNEIIDRAFQRQRRVDRGRKKTAERCAELRARQVHLRELGKRCGQSPETYEEQEAREAKARSFGLVVGLRSLRKERISDPMAPIRLPGVRVFTSPSGETVFGGKGARDNDRLTFKVATEDDFWFHAQDIPGAHVILRNPQRRKSPEPQDCRFAASIAAWYSDARTATAVDVVWTRRRFVRRMRGAPRGTVKIKKFEVVRVTPREPET